MIKLTWDAFKDSDCDSYNVYRSLPGLSIAFPNSLAVNDVLTFSATSVDIQNITFSATDIDSFVTQFNAGAKGAYAVKNTGATAVLIRTTATQRPKLKIYTCTAVTNLAVTPRTIVPQLEWALIGNVTFLDNTFTYNYTDNDGTELDSYRITSVLSSVESLPSLVQAPKLGTDLLCSVEGRVCDSQNRPVSGLEIKAQPRIYETQSDGHGIDVHQLSVYTDAFGRFSLYLPRNTIYLLQIPNVGYNETVCVPDQAAIGFIDLIPTLAGRFSPFGDPQ